MDTPASGDVLEPASGDVLIDITPERVPKLVREANAGDLSAAATLVVYYDALAIENSAKKREWLQFGAARGDCNSIQILIEESVLEEDKNEAKDQSKKYGCDPDSTAKEAN